MAVEQKRGCGYRKVGGLYLVDGGSGMPCCKMPLALNVCPCCGGGIKQSRGWTWIDAGKMFGGSKCTAGQIERMACPAASPELLGKVGLIWIGESFYPRPVDFLNEAATMGISRRMTAVPRNFKANETWVFFAHPKAIQRARKVAPVDGGQTPDGERVEVDYVVTTPDGEPIEGEVFDNEHDAGMRAVSLDLQSPIYGPGVIRVCKPRGFEKIVRQSDMDQVRADQKAHAESEPTVGWSNADEMEESKSALLKTFEKDAARGVTWVPVPDDDPDHQGTVYDRDDEPASATAA